MGKKDFKIKIHTNSKKLQKGALAVAKEGMASNGMEIECPTCHEKVTVRTAITECPRCKTPLRLDL